MDPIKCAVCDQPLGNPIYVSPGEASLTSLCRVEPGNTSVFACKWCGHLQTAPLGNVAAYYDEQYDILVESDEEDQIYEIRDGKSIYRTEHQVRTLLDKLSMQQNIDLLDYGCAKSSTIRALCSVAANVTPHLFDVSSRYIPFWQKFAKPENWAVMKTNPEWLERFDVVTSFFSLEHIPAVRRSVSEIASLLKPGGTFYCVVPNVFTNVADFIVIDHCNHFTRSSLQRLIADAGLDLDQSDEQAHRGAFVILARKPVDAQKLAAQPGSKETASEHDLDRLQTIADYWAAAAAAVRMREAELPAGDPIVIYGAGFYGAFIVSCLANPRRVICHLDQNPFLHGKRFKESPILSPDDLPDTARSIFVGLNPAHARKIISEISSLKSRDLEFFYL